MSLNAIPTFDDPMAEITTSVHKASGADLCEVRYGAVTSTGEPVVPGQGDGHGHLIAIKLGEVYEPLIEREPMGPGDEAEMNRRAATLYDIDRRDWDRAYKSKLIRDLEHDLMQRRRLCSRIEGLTRGRISNLRQLFDEIHTEWDGLKRWGVPAEEELFSRFAQADEACRSVLAEQQANVVTKQALINEAAELASSEEWGKTNAAFEELFGRWRAVPSAGREEDQRLWEEFNGHRREYYHRRDEHFKELRAHQAESREAKEQILEEAHQNYDDLESVQNWPEAGKLMDALMDRWKQAGSAGREHEERLWGEFREIRNRFSAARREHFAELRELREGVAEVKRGLVDEAAAIAALEDYSHEQVERMKQLNTAWKEAGSAGHETDRALWAEFRAAQDGFWDARQLEMRQLHAERIGRMQSAIDRREDQIANLEDQIDNLLDRVETTRNPEKQAEIEGWIAEKKEIIARIEAEIEDMRKRM